MNKGIKRTYKGGQETYSTTSENGNIRLDFNIQDDELVKEDKDVLLNRPNKISLNHKKET